jgi:hypothetical protein
VNVCNSLGLGWTLWATTSTEHVAERATATSEELSKEIFSSHAITRAALLETFFAILVVHLSLLRIV